MSASGVSEDAATVGGDAAGRSIFGALTDSSAPEAGRFGARAPRSPHPDTIATAETMDTTLRRATERKAKWIVAHRSFEARVCFTDTAAVFDLGPRGRLVFAAAWLLAQGALIATAGTRPDHAFGFQMFSESSTLEIHLARKVDDGGAGEEARGTRLVPVKDGTWVAHDRDGNPRRIRWRERVHDPGLGAFDVTIHASYGSAAQLARLQAALDDVARHIPEDAETRGLVADVTVRKNGHDPVVIHLASAPR